MLYRKYRPQSFSELIGQDNITRILRQSILDHKVAHAYLFSGPRGTGKTSTARIMAKAINCLDPQNGEPCNKCANCKAVSSGRFLDLIEIDAASNRGIEEIRDLKEKVGFLPVEGKYKVYIIDEVHMLTGEAFNALLKTLEEPPANVIFILATTEAHKLPATILSRTQRFDFKLANDEDLAKKLLYILKSEGFDSEIEALTLLARGGMGSFRDSETLLDKIVSSLKKGEKLNKDFVENILGYAKSEIIEDFINSLLESDRSKALELFNIVIDGGLNLLQFTKQVLEALRIKLVDGVKENNNSYLRQYMLIIKEFNQVAGELRFALLPRLSVEMAIFNLTAASISPTAPPNSISEVKSEKQPVNKIETVSKPVMALAPKVEKKTVETTVIIQDSAKAIDFTKLTLKWPEVIDQAKKYNHHLMAVLSLAKVKESEDGGLIIGVPYGFHKNRLNEAETKKILQEVFNKVYNQTIPYECQIDKTIQTNHVAKTLKGNADLVEDLLQ